MAGKARGEVYAVGSGSRRVEGKGACGMVWGHGGRVVQEGTVTTGFSASVGKVKNKAVCGGGRQVRAEDHISAPSAQLERQKASWGGRSAVNMLSLPSHLSWRSRTKILD